MSKTLGIDLFCGLGGWSEGLLAEGYDVVGFDIEAHRYGDARYPGQLVIQDVLTIHGSQFKRAALIVASPPCQEYSYMAMPWTRAKQIAKALRGQGPFPEGYKGSRTIAELTALFDACFRIQAEAIAAAGHHIPLVVENVRGAIPWVGRSRAHFGSFHLWGDVPALMPIVSKHTKVPGMGAGWRPPGHPDHQPGLAFNTYADRATKTLAHVNKRDGHSHTRNLTNQREHDAVREGVKQAGTARKAASAQIAKIPFALARHIAAYYKPEGGAE